MIAIVMGTRPEIIKMAPLVDAARKTGVQPLVIFTGQHAQLASPILEYFDLEPDLILESMTAGQSLTQLSARILDQLDEHRNVLSQCHAILVQGDTTSAAMAGYWGFCHRIPVGHVEAGLRTYDLDSPFPEEANRQFISRIARWHFAPTAAARLHLLSERIADSAIEVVGNTSIDALNFALRRTHRPVSEMVQDARAWRESGGRVVLVTAHRRENFGAPLASLASAVLQLSGMFPDALFVWPVHPNPRVQEALGVLRSAPNVRLCSPLGYHDFVWSMGTADLIITDSGGVQEEAPSLGVPILVFRDTTERPEGIEAGCATLVGQDGESVVAWAQKHLQARQRHQIPNPYGDGHAAERIMKVLRSALPGLQLAETRDQRPQGLHPLSSPTP